jgi:hypothetical protein
MAMSDEPQIDAKLEELDRLIAELRKRRQELLETKEGVGAEFASSKREPTVTAAKQTTGSAKVASGSHRPPQSIKEALAQLEVTLNSLEWKGFKKKDGEWAFLRHKDGNLVDELQSSKDFVGELRKGKDVVVGKYRYRVSEDKFLNRYFAG